MTSAELDEEVFKDCGNVPDALELAQGCVRAGIVSQDVLDHLTSLQPQVPNSMKLRYLLIHLHNNIDNDEQLFTRMVQVFLAFRSHPMSASSPSTANDFTFSTEHIPDLAELLVEYAFKWRSIGTALRFKPQDLDNVEACQSLMSHSPQSFLLRILEDWVQRKYEHTLAATRNNLESVLNSRLVGLGVVACELRTNVTLNQHLSVHNEALPYFVEGITLTKHDSTIQYIRTRSRNDRLEAKEDGSVLLEIQVCLDRDIGPRQLKYQWLINGMPVSDNTLHTGTTTPILYVSKADIAMDGFKYSCEVTFSDAVREETMRICSLTSREITLRVSCPLDQYSSSLAAVYSAQPEVPKDTWPPVSSKKYVNLAVIKQEHVNYGAQYARLTIRGDMDDILQHKEKIEYDEVLECLRVGYVLFIEGRPGSGKTTFVHKITQDWVTASDGAIRLVFLVSLRVLNDLNKPNLDLSDILKLFKDLKVSKELLEERNGKGVCFIFDGLDEFSPRDGKFSIVYKLINKDYLNQSSVIVASRPAAIAKLRDWADKVIEVLGFPNEQILEYFDHYPFSTTTKSNDLKAYLQVHPNILHMCYLPVHAAMVAFLFEVAGEVPKTETEIYTHFTRLTLMRSLTKNRAVSADDIDVHNLSGKEQILFDQICKLALEKTIANKQVLRQDEVDSFFQSSKDGDVSLGLITVDCTAGLYGFKNIYTFLHLTFQEYLAAYHISTLSDKEKYELIQLHGDKQHMLVVWKFFCGLDTSSTKYEALAQKKLTRSLFLVQSAYETQESRICNLLVDLLHASFEFEDQYLTIPDFTALGYVMASTSSPLSLSFKKCNMGTEAIHAMSCEKSGESFPVDSLRYHSNGTDVESLQKLLLVTSSTALKLLDIRSSRKIITDKIGLFWTCTNLTVFSINEVDIGSHNLETVLQNCNKLQELTLVGCIRHGGVQTLAANLEHCKKLKLLNVADNSLAETAVFLASGLVLCQSLEILTISGNGINSSCAKVLLESLKSCELKIYSEKITLGNQITVDNLIECLQDCDNLQELHLTPTGPAEKILITIQNWQNLHTLELNFLVNCSIDVNSTFDGLSNLVSVKVWGISQYCVATALASGLTKCTKIVEFQFSYSPVSDEGVLAFTRVLFQCKRIHTLNLSHNGITNSGAKAVFTSIRHLTRLKTLNFSGNSIRCEGTGTVLASLECHRNLCNLNLNENHIGKEGATALSSCLHHWPNLQALSLSGTVENTNIGSIGAVVLAKDLSCCTKLRTLNLSFNDIDEIAATSLVRRLAKCKNLNSLNLKGNKINKDSHCVKATFDMSEESVEVTVSGSGARCHKGDVEILSCLSHQ